MAPIDRGNEGGTDPMTATTIQASVMTVRQPAIPVAAVGAFVAVALAVTMLIAMVPGLARVPATVDQPQAVEAPVGSGPSDSRLIVFTTAAPQPGPHPGR
jgi:hypothetical protein